MTDTPRTDAVTKKRDTSGQNSSVYRWVEEVPAKFARQLEREITELREALVVADECLSLIEDVGHGAMSDNVTSARGIIDKTLNKLC